MWGGADAYNALLWLRWRHDRRSSGLKVALRSSGQWAHDMRGVGRICVPRVLACLVTSFPTWPTAIKASASEQEPAGGAAASSKLEHAGCARGGVQYKHKMLGQADGGRGRSLRAVSDSTESVHGQCPVSTVDRGSRRRRDSPACTCTAGAVAAGTG